MQRRSATLDSLKQVTQAASQANQIRQGVTQLRPGLGAASDVPKKGIYEFPQGGRPYVGQSGNMAERLQQHKRAGKLKEGAPVKTTEICGDQTAREIAEHKRIQELTGGVPARKSSKVANERDPIGPGRRHLLE
jgi:hypothetical protein